MANTDNIMEFNAVKMKNKSLFVTSFRPTIVAFAVLGFNMSPEISDKTPENVAGKMSTLRKFILMIVQLPLFAVVTLSFLYQSVRLVKEITAVPQFGERYVYFRLTIFNGMISGYITFALFFIYRKKVRDFIKLLVDTVATELSLTSRRNAKLFWQTTISFTSIFAILVMSSYFIITIICFVYKNRLTIGLKMNASQDDNTTNFNPLAEYTEEFWLFNFLVAFLTHDYLIHLLILVHVSFVIVILSLRFIIKSKADRFGLFPQVYSLREADKEMANFIKQHRQMTLLVNHANSIFSLLFFVWIITEMLNFIMLLGAIRSSEGYKYTPIDHACVVYSVYSSMSLFIKPMFGSTINSLMIDWLYSVNIIDSFGSIAFGKENSMRGWSEGQENRKSPRATATQMQFKLYCENLQLSQPALTVYGLFQIDRKLIISMADTLLTYSLIMLST